MQLNGITNTCSMFELGGVYIPSIKKLKNKTEFYKFLNKSLDYGENCLTNSCQCIIYNTTDTTVEFATKLKELGFKRVNRYVSNEDNSKKVHVWMLNITNEWNNEYIKANRRK